MSYPNENYSKTIIHSFCRDNMILRLINMHRRFNLESGSATGYYDFYIPLRDEIYVRTGQVSHKIRNCEMICINPWQLRQLSPVRDNLNVIQLTYKAAYINHLFTQLYGRDFGGFFNQPISVENQLYIVIDNLICENYLDSPGKQLMLDSIGYELSISLLRHAVEANAIMKNKEKFCPDLVRDIIEYIDEKYDVNITDLDIAKHIHISKYNMIRQFKQAVGITPHSYLIEVRTSKTKNMLVGTNLTIKQIGTLCGFTTSSYFSEIFKRKTGLTPKEFRRQKQQLPNNCLIFKG